MGAGPPGPHSRLRQRLEAQRRPREMGDMADALRLGWLDAHYVVWIRSDTGGYHLVRLLERFPAADGTEPDYGREGRPSYIFPGEDATAILDRVERECRGNIHRVTGHFMLHARLPDGDLEMVSERGLRAAIKAVFAIESAT